MARNEFLCMQGGNTRVGQNRKSGSKNRKYLTFSAITRTSWLRFPQFRLDSARNSGALFLPRQVRKKELTGAEQLREERMEQVRQAKRAQEQKRVQEARLRAMNKHDF